MILVENDMTNPIVLLLFNSYFQLLPFGGSNHCLWPVSTYLSGFEVESLSVSPFFLLKLMNLVALKIMQLSASSFTSASMFVFI